MTGSLHFLRRVAPIALLAGAAMAACAGIASRSNRTDAVFAPRHARAAPGRLAIGRLRGEIAGTHARAMFVGNLLHHGEAEPHALPPVSTNSSSSDPRGR